MERRFCDNCGHAAENHGEVEKHGYCGYPCLVEDCDCECFEGD